MNDKTLFFYAPNLSYVEEVKRRGSHTRRIQDSEKTTTSLENLVEENKDAHTVIIFSFLPYNIFSIESDAVVNFELDNSMKDLFEETLFELITYGGEENLFGGELFNLLISKENPDKVNYTSPVEIMKKAEGNSFLKVCKELYFLLSNHEYSFLDFVKQPDQYERIIRKHLPNTAPYSTEEVKRKLKRASIWIYQRMVNLAFPFNLPSNAKVEINSKKYFSTLTVNSTEEFNKLNNYGKIKVVKQKPRNNRGRLYLVANSLV